MASVCRWAVIQAPSLLACGGGGGEHWKKDNIIGVSGSVVKRDISNSVSAFHQAIWPSGLTTLHWCMVGSTLNEASRVATSEPIADPVGKGYCNEPIVDPVGKGVLYFRLGLLWLLSTCILHDLQAWRTRTYATAFLRSQYRGWLSSILIIHMPGLTGGWNREGHLSLSVSLDLDSHPKCRCFQHQVKYRHLHSNKVRLCMLQLLQPCIDCFNNTSGLNESFAKFDVGRSQMRLFSVLVVLQNSCSLSTGYQAFDLCSSQVKFPVRKYFRTMKPWRNLDLICTRPLSRYGNVVYKGGKAKLIKFNLVPRPDKPFPYRLPPGHVWLGGGLCGSGSGKGARNHSGVDCAPHVGANSRGGSCQRSIWRLWWVIQIGCAFPVQFKNLDYWYLFQCVISSSFIVIIIVIIPIPNTSPPPSPSFIA